MTANQLFHCKANGVDFEVDPDDPQAQQKLIDFLLSLAPIETVMANAKPKEPEQ